MVQFPQGLRTLKHLLRKYHIWLQPSIVGDVIALRAREPRAVKQFVAESQQLLGFSALSPYGTLVMSRFVHVTILGAKTLS